MESLVKEKIESGFYKSADDVINRSLRLLQKHDEEKLKALREDILVAYEQSQRGESTPLEMQKIIAEEEEKFHQRQKVGQNA